MQEIRQQTKEIYELNKWVTQAETYLKEHKSINPFSQQSKANHETYKQLKKAKARLTELRKQISQFQTESQGKHTKEFLQPDIIIVNPDTEPKGVDIHKTKIFPNPIKWWKMRRLNKKYPHRTVIVHIFLDNGNRRELKVKEQDGGCIYENCFFVFDNVSKRFNIDAREYEYIFFESLSLPVQFDYKYKEGLIKKINFPINPEINLKEIKEIITGSNQIETDAHLNPRAIKETIDGNVIKQLLQAKMADKFWNLMKILLILNLIGTAIIIFSLWQKSKGA